VIICNRKQVHYSYRKIREMMTLNEIHYNPPTSTFLSVVCLAMKSSHTQNTLLRIKATGRYTHYKQVKVVYYYIEKENWKLTITKSKSSCFSYSVVVVHQANFVGKLIWHETTRFGPKRVKLTSFRQRGHWIFNEKWGMALWYGTLTLSPWSSISWTVPMYGHTQSR
jgi:hypothetical protein